MTDARRSAPAAARNADPILAVLKEILPASGLVLEVASGSGDHALHFARAFPKLTWQPSDPDAAALASIDAWRGAEAPVNLLPPLPLDAAEAEWPVRGANAILCINMVHISPWGATLGLLAGAARLLPPGGPLYLYGAYRQRGIAVAPSNEAFDQSLRARNPDWGIRELETVVEAAGRNGLELDRVAEMPANNLSVVFRRT